MAIRPSVSAFGICVAALIGCNRSTESRLIADNSLEPKIEVSAQVGSDQALVLNTNISTTCPNFVAPRLQREIEEGLTCLLRRDTPRTRNIAQTLQRLTSNHLKPVEMRCESSDRGMAWATLPGNPDFPRVQLNISDRAFATDAAYDEHGFATLFHEYLHLAGLPHPHVDGDFEAIDHVVMCEACCFGGSVYLDHPGVNQDFVRETACRFCDDRAPDLSAYQAFFFAVGQGKNSSMFRRLVEGRGLQSITDPTLRAAVEARLETPQQQNKDDDRSEHHMDDRAEHRTGP